MTIEVYTHDLLRMTVEDLGDEEFIDIKDPENETEEHLAHLRKLVDQRTEKDQSRPVNAGELGNRLSHLLERDPTPSSGSRSLSRTPILDWEVEREGGWRDEVEAYHTLVAEGGRPSHPVTLGYDVVDDPEKYEQYKNILSFWHFGGSGYYNEFRYQLIQWRKFRETQEKIRKSYVPRNKFQEYENHILESQEDLGCKWNLRVLADRHEQNRLEDWNEFRAVFYRRLRAIKNKKRVELAEQNLSTYKEKFEDLQARLTDAVTDPDVIYGRLDEIKASEEEVAEAKSRVESAEKGLRAARRNKSTRKNAIIRTAQQELRLAKDNLYQVSKSEEMRRLRDGHEMHLAKDVMLFCEGTLRAAQSEVKRWETFLKWIDDQYPEESTSASLALSKRCAIAVFRSSQLVDEGRESGEKLGASFKSRKICPDTADNNENTTASRKNGPVLSPKQTTMAV
ncbi:hypothetical protein LTR80_011774 [Exophiala xenobiotica]